MRTYPRAGTASGTRERLIAEHVDMARRIALRIARRAPPSVSADDLVSAAVLGLTEACDRFDPGRAEPFVAFAEKRIRGAVLDELRRSDPLSRRDRWAARKVGATLVRLEKLYGRAPEDDEVAAALGVSLEHYRTDLEELPRLSFVELAEHEVGGSSAPSPSDVVERSHAMRQVRSCLSRIPARDAQLLSLYYVEELSYVEIGEVLGVSESRVCQLHGRALSRMRVELESDQEKGRSA